MVDRSHYSTGNPWERQIGFSRAVRVGNIVLTAGTIASDENGVIQGSTCYEQCCYILRKLDGVLREAGSELSHVVRVVCYLTDLGDSDGFTQAHREFFGEILPATTCLQVAGLFGEGARVEIELTAVVPETETS
jgi:enamine deaminase RidA (YjgF/YER057c/UK114 family)